MILFDLYFKYVLYMGMYFFGGFKMFKGNRNRGTSNYTPESSLF